jgi:DNA polymerase elongation subunit (family B)
MRDARDFITRYKDVSGMDIYGMTTFLYPYLFDAYPGEMQYDPSLVSVVTIDIEVAADDGFPNIQTAEKEVTAITLRKNNQSVVFGCGKFKNTSENITYIKCKTEYDLLAKFLTVWKSKQFAPDVITGWNIEFFDIPYMVNRITKLLGKKEAEKLSPWGILEERMIEVNGKENQVFIPVGIAVLDYLQLYRKFKFETQESYRLDYIASAELGERKLDYSEHDSLLGLYKNDYQKFIEYNIRDVDLVYKLEEKLKFIEQVFALAYDAKVNYVDTLTTVRPWDVIIHNYLMERNIVVPQNVHQEVDEQIVGGYVKEPRPGMYRWVVSFDLNSMYPHLIMQYNISPETYVETIDGLTVDSVLDGVVDDVRYYLEEKNVACAASGCLFDKDYQGFLPKLMEKMYNDRVVYKNKMIEAKKAYEKTPTREISNEISRCHNMQMAKKIQLNSAYGALGNQYFRWFDNRHAESITKSGQLAIRWIEREMNKYMNKILHTTDVDYVIASDTDSIYVEMDEVVTNMFAGDGEDNGGSDDPHVVVEALDKWIEAKIQPYINKCYKKLAEYTNAYQQKMFMKRESIANKGIWTAKKRYILNVYNNEGVAYAEPKIKMTGIEAVRSSTPAVCRDKIKKAISIIINKTEDDFIQFISDFREEFRKLPFEDVAFPRGVRGLTKYTDTVSIYTKGTPIHVKGALLYNHFLKQKKLEKELQLIGDSDKIKFSYLKLPNPIRDMVISVPNILPKSFGLDDYIDYDMQFEKSFLEPIKKISKEIGWKTERINTLEAFYGD